MGVFAKLFFDTKQKNKQDKKANYIFYKIVDFVVDKKEYVLQCINTRAVFYVKIVGLVSDLALLYGLHPLQSCFIGIEYAKYIKEANQLGLNNQKQNFSHNHTNRYGKYTLYYQDRNGLVCFTDLNTGAEFIMDPRDIALSEELISEFDAIQAFYIGLLSGLKLNNPTKQGSKEKCRLSTLRIIKGGQNREIFTA